MSSFLFLFATALSSVPGICCESNLSHATNGAQNWDAVSSSHLLETDTATRHWNTTPSGRLTSTGSGTKHWQSTSMNTPHWQSASSVMSSIVSSCSNCLTPTTILSIPTTSETSTATIAAISIAVTASAPTALLTTAEDIATNTPSEATTFSNTTEVPPPTTIAALLTTTETSVATRPNISATENRYWNTTSSMRNATTSPALIPSSISSTSPISSYTTLTGVASLPTSSSKGASSKNVALLPLVMLSAVLLLMF